MNPKSGRIFYAIKTKSNSRSIRYELFDYEAAKKQINRLAESRAHSRLKYMKAIYQEVFSKKNLEILKTTSI